MAISLNTKMSFDTHRKQQKNNHVTMDTKKSAMKYFLMSFFISIGYSRMIFTSPFTPTLMILEGEDFVTSFCRY